MMMGIDLRAVLAACAALCLIGSAHAEDQIQYPSSEYGSKEIEITKTDHDNTLAVGYGALPWLHVEAEGEWRRDQYRSLDLETIAVVTGCYDPDFDGDCHPTTFAAAFYGEYEHRWKSTRPDNVTFGPVVSLNLAPLAVTVNVLGERAFGLNHDDDWGLSTFVEASWHVFDYASPVIEYQGSVEDIKAPGKLNDQDHAIGPGLIGSIGGLHYRAAWLFGLTDGAVKGRPMLRFEYAF